MIRRLVSIKTGKVTYQVDLYAPDGSRLRKTFKLVRDAKDYEAQAQVAKKTNKWPQLIEPPKKITFTELTARYTESQRHQKSWDSFKAKILPVLLAHFGELLLQDLTYFYLEKFRQERLAGRLKSGRTRSPARVNRELAVLRHMLNKAVSWDLLQTSPFAKGESLQLPEPRGRLRYLTHGEIPRLLEELPPHLGPLVRLALHTGLRKGELMGLKWDQVRQGCLYLDGSDTKNSEPRSIPLNEEALAALEDQRRRHQLTSAYIFPKATTREPYKEIKDGFAAACRRAGIYNFRFHDLRHTFASHLAMAGVPLTTIAKLLGHKTLTMTLRYAHLSPGHLQEAVAKLVGDNKISAIIGKKTKSKT